MPLGAFSGRVDSILLIAELYSVASRARVFGNVEFEGPMEGMMASPIASNVVHCAWVSTSPSGGGGRGLARGAMSFNCWVVILYLESDASQDRAFLASQKLL